MCLLLSSVLVQDCCASIREELKYAIVKNTMVAVEGDLMYSVSFEEDSHLPESSSLQKLRSNPVDLSEEKFAKYKERFGVDGVIGRDIVKNTEIFIERATNSIVFSENSLLEDRYKLRMPIQQEEGKYFAIAERAAGNVRFQMRGLFLMGASNKILPNYPNAVEAFCNSNFEFPGLPRFAECSVASKEIDGPEKSNFGLNLVANDEVVISLRKGLIGMWNNSKIADVRYLLLEICGIRFRDIDGTLVLPDDDSFSEAPIPTDARLVKVNSQSFEDFTSEVEKPLSETYFSIKLKTFKLKTITLEKDGKTWDINMKSKDDGELLACHGTQKRGEQAGASSCLHRSILHGLPFCGGLHSRTLEATTTSNPKRNKL